jgi:hypothetical protein
MTERLKGVYLLAIVIGVLAFLYTEFTLNFTFHWVTDGDLGIGLELPANFHLIAPAGFVSWGFYFAAGGDLDAVKKVAVSSVAGSVAALIVMAVGPEFADNPDFWGISLMVGITALAAVLSTPYGWVWFNILATLFIGILMGYLSSTITAAITPAPAEEAAA